MGGHACRPPTVVCWAYNKDSVCPKAGLYLRASSGDTEGTVILAQCFRPNTSVIFIFNLTGLSSVLRVGKAAPQLSICSKYTTPLVERPGSRNVSCLRFDRELCCIKKG